MALCQTKLQGIAGTNHVFAFGHRGGYREDGRSVGGPCRPTQSRCCKDEYCCEPPKSLNSRAMRERKAVCKSPQRYLFATKPLAYSYGILLTFAMQWRNSVRSERQRIHGEPVVTFGRNIHQIEPAVE